MKSKEHFPAGDKILGLLSISLWVVAAVTVLPGLTWEFPSDFRLFGAMEERYERDGF